MIHPVSRTDRGPLAEWWWSVDRVLFAALVTLAIAGFVLGLAASPAVAGQRGFSMFHFVEKQLRFLVPALGVMFVMSLLSVRQVLQAGAALFVVAFAMLVATIFIGPELNGAHRWLAFAGMTVQPSEFIKPALVVVLAAIFTDLGTGPRGLGAAAIIYGPVAAVLLLQPDFGQTVIVTLALGALYFMAGGPMAVFAALGAGGLALAGFAYLTLDHVQQRVHRFLDPASGDNFQVETALAAFQAGGFLGVGPGDGDVKYVLPDAHTDFILAVAGEEFGVLACLVIAGLFAFIVLRGLSRATAVSNRFAELAASGLFLLFGAQALINMGVNLGILPAKGMTLPFLSYGGSSLLALAIGMGFALALTRATPRREARPA